MSLFLLVFWSGVDACERGIQSRFLHVVQVWSAQRRSAVRTQVKKLKQLRECAGHHKPLPSTSSVLFRELINNLA